MSMHRPANAHSKSAHLLGVGCTAGTAVGFTRTRQRTTLARVSLPRVEEVAANLSPGICLARRLRDGALRIEPLGLELEAVGLTPDVVEALDHLMEEPTPPPSARHMGAHSALLDERRMCAISAGLPWFIDDEGRVVRVQSRFVRRRLPSIARRCFLVLVGSLTSVSPRHPARHYHRNRDRYHADQ